MFGFFDHSIETAQATVLGATLLNYRTADVHARPKYEFLLEVKPVQGEPFRTTTQQYLPPMTRPPQAGETVNVKYSPKNHKVQLELKGDGRYDLNMLVKAQQEAERKRQEAILSSPPGTPVAPPSTGIYWQLYKRTEDTNSPA